MSGRLDEIRARWAAWPSLDIGDDGDLWCGDVRIGAVDAGTAEEAITNAPADVAWLVGQVETLAGPHSLFTVMAERDEARVQVANQRVDLRTLIAERDEARKDLEAERDTVEQLESLVELVDAALPEGDGTLEERVEELVERAERAEEAKRANAVVTAALVDGLEAERDDALRELARERERVQTLTALLDAQSPSFQALMDHVEANLKAQGWVKGTEADKLIEGAVAVDVLRRVDTVLTGLAAVGTIASDARIAVDVRRFLEKVEVPRE